MKRFLCNLFGIPLIALVDHDGEWNIRVAHHIGDFWLVARFFELSTQLKSDGTVSGPRYVYLWYPVNRWAGRIPREEKT